MTTQDFVFASFNMALGYTADDKDDLIRDFGLSEKTAEETVKAMSEIKQPWVWED